MAGELSPVLQAFFEGQRGQASLINQAREIQQSAEARENQKIERQQRQQSLDDVMKRFDASHKLEQSRVENELKRTQLEHDSHMMQARNAFIEGLQNESIPIKQEFQPTGMAIPGLPKLEPPAQTGGEQQQMLQSASPDIMIPGGGLPSLQPATTQSMQLPGGENLTVPTPKTHAALTKAAEQAKSDIAVQQANKIYDATRGPALEQQLEFKQQQLAQKESEYKDKLANHELLFNLGLGSKEEIARLKEQHETEKRYGFRSPEQYKTDVENSGREVALGKLGYSQIVDPQEKRDVKEWLDSHKYGIVDTKKGESIMTHAADAAQALVLLNRMKELTGKSTAGQVANAVRNLVPGGMNAKASEFASLQNDLIAPLERARGLSLARAGASPGIQKLQKLTPPSFTDSPEAVAYKAPAALDIHLSAAQADMANFTNEHRKLFWNRFISDYPSILNDPKIGPKLYKAAANGIYEAGVK